jgi:HAD superfamily hydrolase (TIGR01662 family)
MSAPLSGIRAVFFDVDFTLIYPGPRFQGEGYRRFCASHAVDIDAARFDAAVAAASSILDDVEEPLYDDGLFIHYTATIIEQMGGRGPNVVRAAREIYTEWATNHHFELYDDVAPVLQDLARLGMTIGVISNSHRSLDAFRDHFALNGVISAAVSSSVHGYMKPHPSIFERAMAEAGVQPSESLMVGDSLKADVVGALGAGMRAVLLRRSGELPPTLPSGVPVIRTLDDLLSHVRDAPRASHDRPAVS